jgi:beta-lactam-binding protein with PASTA domain
VLVGSDRPAPSGVATSSAPAVDGYVPTTMPDVLGAPLPRAVELIVQADLQVVEILFAPGRDGLVVATEPTAGEAVTAGTGVSLWIGSG